MQPMLVARMPLGGMRTSLPSTSSYCQSSSGSASRSSMVMRPMCGTTSAHGARGSGGSAYAAAMSSPRSSAAIGGIGALTVLIAQMRNGLRIRRYGEGRDVAQGAFDFLSRQLVVFQLAGEVGIVGGHIEVAVTAEVEQDRLLLALFLAAQRFVDGRLDGVRRFRSRDDGLAAGKSDRGAEDIQLRIGARLD